MVISAKVLNMVFDPEGDYYTDKIKPNSVDTLMLSVGAKSMQFGLVGTVFQPNFNGNKNLMRVKGGILTHYAIEEMPRSWNLSDGDTTFLSDSQAYYIYAKVLKQGNTGTIVFTPQQIGVEEDAMNYHFWIGVVNSGRYNVTCPVRRFDLWFYNRQRKIYQNRTYSIS